MNRAKRGDRGDRGIEAALDLAEPKCAIKMSSFWSGDFQLDQGTYITVSVRAENEKGWSESSRWNTEGATVEGTATKVTW